jgi:hypothetical protein
MRWHVRRAAQTPNGKAVGESFSTDDGAGCRRRRIVRHSGCGAGPHEFRSM